MVDRVGVQVEGFRELQRDFLALGAELDDLKDANAKIAQLGAERAAVHAPKGKTRRLSNSIRGNRAKAKAVVIAGKAAAPHAGPINYGWPAHNIAASEFMQKASDELEPIAVDLYTADINQAIRKRGLQ